MLTALALCAHLAATGHAVVDCQAVPPSGAVFTVTETGHRGLLLHPDAAHWDAELATPRDPVFTVYVSHAAHVIVLVQAPETRIAWWVDALDRMCGATADRADAAAQIAAERSNAGGVVDLRRLHEAGERVRLDDAMIADVTRRYRQATGKAFPSAVCGP